MKALPILHQKLILGLKGTWIILKLGHSILNMNLKEACSLSNKEVIQTITVSAAGWAGLIFPTYKTPES